MEFVTKQISLSLLDKAAHNPPYRTKNVKELAESMTKHGQIIPVVVVPHKNRYELIDGHRRVAVAEQNEWPTIKALIIDSKDKYGLYADFNFTAKKLTGADALYIWLNRPSAVHLKLQKKIEQAEKALGRERLERMCQARFGVALFFKSWMIADYCSFTAPTSVCKVVDWLMACRCQRKVVAMMLDNVSPKVLIKAMHNNESV